MHGTNLSANVDFDRVGTATYARNGQLKLDLLLEEAQWKNKLITGWFLSDEVRDDLPLWIVSWPRNYIAGLLLYFGLCSAWCFVVYVMYGTEFYKEDEIPTFDAMKLQMWVSLQAMPFYTLLPVATETCVLQGWTRAYPRIDDPVVDGHGYAVYALQFVLYMACVELA